MSDIMACALWGDFTITGWSLQFVCSCEMLSLGGRQLTFFMNCKLMFFERTLHTEKTNQNVPY